MLKSLLLTCALFATTLLAAQQSFPVPTLQTVDGQAAELSDYVGNGKPTVIAVWATWCQPCHQELDHMKSYLDKWEGEYGAQVLAVSVDRPFHVKRITPLVKRKGWKYDILVDSQGQLQGALGFSSIPQMYILDGDGNVVREFKGYRSGREQQVDAVLTDLKSR